jgi:hypothetical protein
MSRKPNWLNRPYFFLGFISGIVVILLVLGVLFSRYASLVSYAGVTQPKVAMEQTAGAQWVNYQGRLLEPASGAPKADGTYAITFSLYTVESGGAAQWSETKNVVVTNGQFSTMLGSTTPFHLGLLNGQDLWLGIQVGADPEAAPRQRIGHSIYSMYSANAGLLEGKSSSDFAAADHSHGATGLLKTTVLDVSCSSSSTVVDSTFKKIAELGSFSKIDASSTVEIMYSGRIAVVTSFSGGSTGARFELRVNNNATTNGRARAIVKAGEVGGNGVPVAVTGIFTGLGAGTHAVSMWAMTIYGTGLGAMVDPGCWSSDHLVIKELK